MSHDPDVHPIKIISNQPVSNDSPQLHQFKKPEKIYTKAFTGLFRNLRITGGAFLFGLFFLTAWISWDGQQIVLFDLPARQFHLFGSVFWPQDFFLLALALMICAFGLFSITVFLGRIWCGYACPQSVFMWVFMWAEKITEGDRNARMKMSKKPFSLTKAYKKTLKHSLWLSIAFATGFTFVGYFTPIREYAFEFFSGQADSTAYFWTAFFTLATYINAGFAREKVCLHMCPYARFQGVMFDSDTLVVAYDKVRGEPRGARKRNIQDPRSVGKGDCIDCNLCVHVCPTGIDIRNGLQYECLSCGACIDACNTVMDKMKYPRGLIRYASEHSLNGHHKHWLRSRLIGYAAILISLFGLLAFMLVDRSLVEVDLQRGRGALYQYAGDSIQNSYLVKIANKDTRDHDFTIEVLSDSKTLEVKGRKRLFVSSGEVASSSIRIKLSKDQIDQQEIPLIIRVSSASSPDISQTTEEHFISPRIYQRSQQGSTP